MRNTHFGCLMLLASLCLSTACDKKSEDFTTNEQSKKENVWEINETDYTFQVETIDSAQFHAFKKSAKISSNPIKKVTDFEIVKKLLKGIIEFEELDSYPSIKKIHFRNGTSWESGNDEDLFIAYYPEEDIIGLEGGHSSDLSFNLKNGKPIEETGNPDHIKTSPNKTFRLNGFYDGQECITYFIEKNINDAFIKVIPLSEELNKGRKMNICSAQEGFWIDDNTLLLRENQAYDQDGNRKIKFYKITIIKANPFVKKVESLKNISDFIPKEWKEILRESGDLNGDGIEDAVIVIEDTDPANFQKNDGLGTDKLNLNPRTLLVLFKEKNGEFRLGAKNDKGFIEPENSEMNPCLADPLLTEGGINVTKGLLKINFNYWLSCGSYSVNNSIYTFRFQNNHFRLIGFDHSDFSRASGEENTSSINFLTNRKSSTTGGSAFDDNESKPVTTWKNISVKEVYTLDNLSEVTVFNY